MRFLASLVLLSGLASITGAAACAAPASEEPGSSDSAYTATETQLRASTDPIEGELAAIESVQGAGLKAITLWKRNTELNGRDVWLTIQGSDSESRRVWRTRENVLGVSSVQYTPGRTRFIGTEHSQGGSSYDPYWSKTEFWLDATIEQANGVIGSTLVLQKRQLGGEHGYSVESTNDPLSTLLGQIQQMDTAVGSEARARLITLDPSNHRDPNGRKLVLVLVDGENYHVFPLDLRVDYARGPSFTGATSLAFEALERSADGQTSSKHYSVSWSQISKPSIKLMP